MKKHYTLTGKLPAVLAALLLSVTSFTSSVAQQPILSFNTVLSGLTAPLDVVNAGDNTNRLFIVQRAGQIRIVSGGALLPGNFLDISSLIVAGGEQGLLSLAFHPDYENNRYFFVYYTRAGDAAVTIARYQTSIGNPNVADAGSGVVLITIAKTPGQTNHNGGKLNFGPDGYLYFATGDGGGGGDPDNNAQNGNALQGKMFRLDVSNFTTAPYYFIPPTNPYVSNPNIRDELYAIGLRNPWRWSFDRLNGNMWIADVGQGAWEEVNFRPAGSTAGLNYGWDCYEGNHVFTNSAACQATTDTVAPIFEYPHNAEGGISVTGGYVYRGSLYPAMYGYYIMADFGSANVWKIIPNGTGWSVTRQTGLPGSIVGFGESESGELYALSLGGTLYQVAATADAPLPVTLLNLYATPGNGAVAVTWRTSYELNIKQFEVEYSEDGMTFKTAGTVPAVNSSTGNAYSFRHVSTTEFKDKLYYRLRTVDVDGKYEYSNIVSVLITDKMTNYINPTVISNGVVTLYLNNTFRQIEVVSMDGRVLMRQQLSGRTGRIDIPLPPLVKGPLMIRVQSDDKQQDIVQKVIVQ
jgi:glucose/arabinose dehydrogenase